MRYDYVTESGKTITQETTMLTYFYVEILGPYDSTVYGPFPKLESAGEFADKKRYALDPKVFDVYVYDHADYVKKVAEVGPINVETPDEYVS